MLPFDKKRDRYEKRSVNTPRKGCVLIVAEGVMLPGKNQHRNRVHRTDSSSAENDEGPSEDLLLPSRVINRDITCFAAFDFSRFGMKDFR